jgi:hypothetical protein
LALAATLEATALTSPALVHPLTVGWLATLPPSAHALPRAVAEAEATWGDAPPSAHLRCDAPTLSLAQHRLTRALYGAAAASPEGATAAAAAAAALLTWLERAPALALAPH